MKVKFVLLTLILLPTSLFAQMFSVGGDSAPRQRASANYFRIGYSPVEFSYSGKSSVVPPQDRLDFESPAIHIGFETPGLSASLSFVNKFTGAEDERYLNLTLDYINRFAFVRSTFFQFGVPLGLSTNLVSVRKEQLNNDFSQSVFGFGLGAFTAFQIPDKLVFSIEGIPSYGFSNSNGGLFGGSNKSLTATARIDFLNAFPGRGISLGYDYKTSSYDLDDDQFDYNLNYHLITLGISL